MKKNHFKYLGILILFNVLAFNPLNAAHIVGGDITYRIISTTETTATIEVFFTMYRDETGGGAEFDLDARIGIFRGLGNSWDFVTERRVNPTNLQFVDIISTDPCAEVQDEIIIESAVYSFEITLDKITENYMIAYQRCCRNDDIDNLVNSGDTGAAFVLEIFPAAFESESSSPVFNFPPPNIVCANFPVVYDNSATDPDGDEIVYSFCTPLTAGGTDGSGGQGSGDPESCTGVRPAPPDCLPPFFPVIFIPGASGNAPVPGTPGLSIDSSTGIVTGRPNTLGLYVLTVCVEEYRDGELLSIVRQDYQINVGICESRVSISAATNSDFANDSLVFSPPQVFASDEFLVVNSCGDLVVDMGCAVCQNNFADPVIRWEIDIPGGQLTSDEAFWIANFPDYGIYDGTFFFQEQDGSFGCNDTIPLRVEIYPPYVPDIQFDYDPCVFAPITLVNATPENMLNPLVRKEWWVNDFQIGIDVDEVVFTPESVGSYKVELMLFDDNNCLYTRTRNFEFYPTDGIEINASNYLACEPASIAFMARGNILNEEYDVLWDFGDGSPIVNDPSPTHIYDSPGSFTVSVEVLSPSGCEEDFNFDSWIEIMESPDAAFSFTPENPNFLDKELFFFDESVNAMGRQWNFANLGTSLQENPNFTFPDTGFYDVRLIAFHPNGCPDTLIQRIDISPEVIMYLPNAFSPNNDGKNDSFMPVGLFSLVRSYDFSIWNRWGERIFQTDQPDLAWNGKKDNTGELSPEGVYIYTVNYVGPRGGQETFKGQVTLLR